MTRILQTIGTGEFFETTFLTPPCGENQIKVESVMTGICRSDIDMMLGTFGPLPKEMQGHEGLGRVTEVGSLINDVKIGDYVATRGEPAYADTYNVRHHEYVKVPSADPKYILEPVACGINLILQSADSIEKLLRRAQLKQNPNLKILILGSGMLAWVAYHYVKYKWPTQQFDITVVGKSNKNIWQDLLVETYQGEFDIVIDLSNKDDIFTKPILREEALIIFGVQKSIVTDFSSLLWKACTLIFPSPRAETFYDSMVQAEQTITNNVINVDHFWTKGYNRNTEWKQAFADGVTRQPNYSRGYIYW